MLITTFFPNFKNKKIETSETEINLVIGGEGPPLLLLHGYPQSHIMWHKVAPILAEKFTVVATDLRGYGDSGKPKTDEKHIPYCKRAMAKDQVEVMKALGFDTFKVIAHDRGGKGCSQNGVGLSTKSREISFIRYSPNFMVIRPYGSSICYELLALVLFDSALSITRNVDWQ